MTSIFRRAAHGARIFKYGFAVRVLLYAAALAALAGIISLEADSVCVITGEQRDWNAVLYSIFQKKDAALLNDDAEAIKSMYVPGELNSRWAIEAEIKRADYLKDWSARQGIRFTAIGSEVVVKRVRKVGRGYAFYAVVSTSYAYSYEDRPEVTNLFRIGTYHSIDLIPGQGRDAWLISREWYLDPFQDSLNRKTLASDEIKRFVTAQTPRDFSGLCATRRRAVEYADRWAGAASGGENGYAYNKKYPDYNGRGGDCSNYVSQILHESGFKTTYGWNYSGDSASRSWCNAAGLQSYLVYSGKARVIAKGAYGDVYKAAYGLAPGDVIAYQEKGKVVHMAFVSAQDSKGYPLVNTHTTDRYHVPWDLGWNDDDIKYILMKVNYPE